MKNRKSLIGKILTFFILFSFVFSPLIVAATEVIIVEPTPDVTPPILKNLSISATQVSVGNTVKIAADVSDDLSGVKYVSIYYKGPKWAKTVSLYLNPNTQKYEGSISFNDYESGKWILNSISLSDNKDNSVTIYDDSTNYSKSMDLTPYTIQVDGGLEDTTPPVLNSIDVPSPAQVSPGGIITFSADATDDGAGVSYLTVAFIKPSGNISRTNLYFDKTTEKYVGSIRIDKYDELGDWKLSTVTLMDNANNSVSIYDSTINNNNVEKRDFSNYKFRVVDTTPDLLAPILNSLSISLEQIKESSALIKLTADCMDNLSGLSYLSAYYTKPSGQSYYVSFSYNSNTRKYEGLIPIDKFDQLGTWKLSSISLHDEKSNSKQIFNISQGSNYLDQMDFNPFNFTVRGVITIPPDTPFSIKVSPGSLTLKPGESQKLSTVLNMTRSGSKDITLGTSGTIYTSSDPSTVKVDQNGQITVEPDAKPGVVYVQAENSGLFSQVEVKIPGETYKGSLRIDPIKVNMSSGQTKQLNVIVTLPDGTSRDVTSGATGTIYESLDSDNVKINQNGLIKVADDSKQGNYKIKVNYNGIQGECIVSVTGPPVVKNLVMEPETATVNAGESIQLSVRALMSDGTSKDVTSGLMGVQYTTTDKNLATVDSEGLITTNPDSKGGTVTVSANLKGINIQCQVIIKQNPASQVKELSINPDNITLKPGETYQIAVSAVMADENKRDVTNGIEGTRYSSNISSRAEVSADGLITIPQDAPSGIVTISAVYGGKVAKTVITIPSPPTLDYIEMGPTSIIMKPGETQQIQVFAFYTDGSEKDVTNGSECIRYSSNLNSRAVVNSDGLITIPQGASSGTVTISAVYGGKAAKTIITIPSPPTLDHIEMGPTSITMKSGETQQIQVFAFYTDGSEKDVTNGSEGIRYSSNLSSRAVVNANGLISIPQDAPSGTVTISAVYGGKAAKTVITIPSPPTLDHIEMGPTSITMKPGEIEQIQVLAYYSDGTIKDVSKGIEGIRYSSNLPSRAEISEDGLISIPANATHGTATITAKFGGKVQNSLVTIPSPPVLDHIDITPDSATKKQGETQQVKVTAYFSDGRTKDVTNGSNGTRYSSNLNSRGSVSEDGLITIPSNASSGIVTISAVYSGKVARTIITIPNPPVLDHLEMETTSLTMKTGDVQQLQIIAYYTDGSTKDVTLGSNGTRYSSNLLSRAVVSIDGLIEIPYNAPSGIVKISAVYGGKVVDCNILIQ